MEQPSAIALRILEIMEYYGLSKQLFADIINIRLPSLLHIYMGRNEASVKVIQHILIKFPEVSPDYLLLGRGSLLRS